MGNDSSKATVQMNPARPGRSLVQSSSQRFRAIADNYNSLEQVQAALRREGLESSQLIVAVDFTKSNEWTGRQSFGGQCLHALQPGRMNFYEQAITIIGRTLAAFDDDGLIPCYGFGDVRTQDARVFSFQPGDTPCVGLDTVCGTYRALVPHVRLAGPTSFAPAIHQAVRQVVAAGCAYHILLIVADGQVTRPSDMPRGQLSVQEQATINAIVMASEYPLSIVMVGVGDGPWDVMREFDDALPARRFDNFQFVNFTEIAAGPLRHDPPRMEAQFALRALMEIPEQYKLIQKLGMLGRQRPLRIQPAPPLDPPGPTGAQAPPPGLMAGQPPAAMYAPPPGYPQAGAAAPAVGYPAMVAASPSFGAQQSAGYMAPPQAGMYPAAFPEPVKGGSMPQQPQPAMAGGYPQAAAGGGAAPGPSHARSSRNADVDPLFVCPITQEVMVDPVIAADGQTYDRAAITEWFTRHDTSPMTMVAVPNKNLIPNHALRSAIMEATSGNPAAQRISSGRYQ
mmetsp:Transcript_3799/g.9493  ORF Transcript_3799/g.9493 Transcript_3799/m.9493 type:complete len:509 (-) Transcript_3799:566-2092(-)|eukprot:CAMPEP_0202883806 /NCGR_PEP_ID=MMETSP1391-20130828/39976_1 /ASSEMBLY_ACC=CAM_ASM_000867 /TAXON_ID=1034604 /ORGANISM="Chlamydomonas leiostraca, Strain SAG 11-49" /LENGTH=508 /DNA_ID=CAMNT_0049566885 /DNA_START=184 /DNA_END=1710 /DNA_ORIENTATION=+